SGRDRPDGDPRPLRPDAEARELPAAPVLFRRGQDPSGCEPALPELEIPAIPVAPAHHGLPLLAEPRLDGREALGGRVPVLAPQRHRPWPRHHERGRATPPP